MISRLIQSTIGRYVYLLSSDQLPGINQYFRQTQNFKSREIS